MCANYKRIYIYILFIPAVLKIELFPAIGPSSLLINITEGKVHRHKYKKKKELFYFKDNVCVRKTKQINTVEKILV